MPVKHALKTIRSFAAFLSEHRWLTATVLALAILIGIAVWLMRPKVPAFAVTRGDLVQTVVASGRVENPLRVDIGSQITGTVATIPVSEGQSVKSGQTLITLEADEVRAQVEQAHFVVAQAESRTRQIREFSLPEAEQALRQAEINLTNAKRQYQRTKELSAKGFISDSQLDEASKNLNLAESQVRSARLQVADNRPAGSTSRQAQMLLQQARASLQAVLAIFEHSSIKAPADGILIARNVERGDVVQPGKALMVLSPTGETQLVVQIDEKNLSLLAFGQKALASADAYPLETFPAELVYINPAVDPQRGSLEIKLRVPSPPSYLRQDMTVSVDIEVARKANTLVLPTAAIRDSATKQPWVMRVEAGRARRQPVKLGLRGATKAEILQGLSAGDVVLSDSAGNPAEGRSVRPDIRP